MVLESLVEDSLRGDVLYDLYDRSYEPLVFVAQCTVLLYALALCMHKYIHVSDICILRINPVLCHLLNSSSSVWFSPHANMNHDKAEGLHAGRGARGLSGSLAARRSSEHLLNRS